MIVVPDDIGHGSFFHSSGNLIQHEESFIAFRMLRALFFGQQGIELHGHQRGIDHNVLGRAGMNAGSANFHFCLCGIEVFIFHDAEFSAIYRIGFVCRETGTVKMGSPHSNLLVRRKGDAQLAVGELGMVVEKLYHMHDLRHTCLVIRAEKRRPVRGDERFPHVVLKFRESIRRQQRI